MRFGFEIKNLTRGVLLRKVAEKVKMKNLQKNIVPAKNEQELSPQLINELEGFGQ